MVLHRLEWMRMPESWVYFQYFQNVCWYVCSCSYDLSLCVSGGRANFKIWKPWNLFCNIPEPHFWKIVHDWCVCLFQLLGDVWYQLPRFFYLSSYKTLLNLLLYECPVSSVMQYPFLFPKCPKPVLFARLWKQLLECSNIRASPVSPTSDCYSGLLMGLLLCLTAS